MFIQIKRWFRKRKPHVRVSIKGSGICLIVNGEYWNA